MSIDYTQHPSSYRDPSGFIFEKAGKLYRQVNISSRNDYDYFISSGCYDQFIKKELLIRHETINENLTGSTDWYTTLLPEKIDFISYPYEWSFDMLKDAALLTLQLLKESISFGLILKDATPYNIQWHQGKLIFIDTLSFEKYDELNPWVAYRQFCECFLGPLLLMHYNKIPLHQLFLAYPDGIPLTVIKSLLPWKSRLSLYAYLHIHLHAKIADREKGTNNKSSSVFSRQKLLNLSSSLETLIRKMTAPPSSSVWHNYYEEASQRNEYLDEKKKLVTKWVEELAPTVTTAIDFGANEGEFSKITTSYQIKTIATDFAADCINKLYNEIKLNGEKKLQPLIQNLATPSPANGALNTERTSFIQRAYADLGLALALIHHLAIGKNMTFDMIAEFFSHACRYLIIEFVPKEDEKVQLMLQQKENIYPDYTTEKFTLSFEKKFHITLKQAIPGSQRVLYLVERKKN